MTEPTEQTIDLVNELLLSAIKPYGPYVMGVVTVMAFNAGCQPDRQLLFAASQASTERDADVIFEAWMERGKQS